MLGFVYSARINKSRPLRKHKPYWLTLTRMDSTKNLKCTLQHSFKSCDPMIRVSSRGETVTKQSLPHDSCSAKTLVRQGGPGIGSSVEEWIYHHSKLQNATMFIQCGEDFWPEQGLLAALMGAHKFSKYWGKNAISVSVMCRLCLCYVQLS